MDEPEVEEAVEIEARDVPTSSQVLMTLWKDGSITFCFKKEASLDHVFREAGCLNMDPSPMNRQLFQFVKAFYSGLGLKLKTLTEEAEGNEQKAQ